jgi:hypothetical protein
MSSTENLSTCLVNGEPLKVKHKIVPVPGSIRQIVGGMFQGAEIENAERTGTCPNCGAHVKLSAKGFMTAHTVRNAPKPADKGLSDQSYDVADSGARVGDPEAGVQRRKVDVLGALEAGAVMVPVKGENGRVKLEERPGTEDNVRAAFDYWVSRKPRSESARAAQNKNVTELSRRLDAMRKGRDRLRASMEDAAQGHRGPTLVRGRDTAPRLRDPELPFTESTDLRRDGSVRKTTTLDQPLGRERFDRKITTVPEPKPKRTAAERRRYRRAQQQARKGK